MLLAVLRQCTRRLVPGLSFCLAMTMMAQHILVWTVSTLGTVQIKQESKSRNWRLIQSLEVDSLNQESRFPLARFVAFIRTYSLGYLNFLRSDPERLRTTRSRSGCFVSHCGMSTSVIICGCSMILISQ